MAGRRASPKRPASAAERMRRYRARRRAAGLRLDRQWVPASGPRATRVYSSHRILDARSLALHCLIARKISRDPRLLEVARRNLDRWLRTRKDNPPRVYLEWQRILSRPWQEVAAVLTDLSENAVRLRQSSPFAGVLTQAERRRVYAAFRG